MGESNSLGGINFSGEPEDSNPLVQIDQACKTLRDQGFVTDGIDLYRQHPNLRAARGESVRAIAVLVAQAELFVHTGIGVEVVIQPLVDQAGAMALQTILHVGERLPNSN